MSLRQIWVRNKAIDEAKERVRSAIYNSQLDFPTRRVTINLAPANLPKHGAHFDLPIAVAILAVSGQLRQEEINNSIFAGELALNGALRPIIGSINLSELAERSGLTSIFVPKANADEAAIIEGVEVYGVESLSELFLHLKGEKKLLPHSAPDVSVVATKDTAKLEDVRGQAQAKRAMIIAAAGHHNILLSGPPGAGKTMLARILPSLLPPLSLKERIEVTKLHSAAGETVQRLLSDRPFRAPHHTASHISLIGGGQRPKPGEISLAHLGVLFLDEIPEYSRLALESLRQPLEDRIINISRANERLSYPANFMLVATQNPCPCGYFGDTVKECSCSSIQIINYKKRLSGPLLDRIDIVVEVARIDYKHLLNEYPPEVSYDHAEQISRARDLQFKRYGDSSITNSVLSSQDVNKLITLKPKIKQLLAFAAERLGLTARSYFKVIKIARTIADLEGTEDITEAHISEALQYRAQA